jgi:Carboxypeptidase regulatory-like domain
MPSFTPLLSRLVSMLVLCGAFAISLAAQTPKPPAAAQEPPAPKSTVKGRVVYDDTSDPVRRAPVTLLQLPERGQHSSATGRDGKFEIRDVPAGVYFVMVDSPGIISPVSFLKIDENGPPEALNVKEIKEFCTQVAVDGTNDVDITVHARKGGTISGKVTYSDGPIAVNAQVSVLRRKDNAVTRVFAGFSAAALLALRTDDRGRYRLAGLPPGEYIVTAAESNTVPGQAGGDGFADLFRSDALAISYYGNSNKLSDALPVTVELGSETNNIDMVLPDATPHTISGSVVAKADGRVVASATLSIRNKEQAPSFARGQQQFGTGSDGQWMLPGVPDGTYIISVEPPYETSDAPTVGTEDEPKQAVMPKRKMLPKEMDLTVAGSDVGGIQIELAEGATISGTIETPAVTDNERSYITVRYAYEGRTSVDYNSYNNAVQARDGVFTIEQLRPGKIYLNAEAMMMGSGAGDSAKYYVKSITLNGNDLMQKPLTIEGGQAISGVKIVLSTDVAHASVQLIDSKGKPVPARAVQIVSVNPSRWSFSNPRVADVTDVNGTVSFSGPPGDYMVIVAGTDDVWPPSPNLIQAASQTATRIKLKPGDNKTITVNLN